MYLGVLMRVCCAVAWGMALLPILPARAAEPASPPSSIAIAQTGSRASVASGQRIGSIESGLIAAKASAEVRYLGNWIQARNDSGGRPFAIVDKKEARLYVFDEYQTLVGSSVVLTGAMPGDESVPGVGQRAQSSRLARHERTTPAGRFESQPGQNLAGEDIVWFDYDAALAIHRLRPDATHAVRSQRLATATPDDNRASLGCVVVPVAFYERVVRPWLGARRGAVYVLPDKRPVQAWWPSDAPLIARGD